MLVIPNGAAHACLRTAVRRTHQLFRFQGAVETLISVGCPGTSWLMPGSSPFRDTHRSSEVEWAKTQTTNKNVEWLNATGAWTFIVTLILLTWLVLSLVVDAGMAWTYVHLLHGVVTYYLLHWNKGSPIEMDQGKYDSLTFWEQLDDGVQNTSNRKFFTIVPVVLFFLASHGTDFGRQPLGLNVIVLMVLLVAKLPSLHKVRILGINKY